MTSTHASHRSADGPTPPFDSLQARLLPAADLVMVLMLSRPPSGTLRTTRVTLGTILLAAGVVMASLALAGVIAWRTIAGHGAVWLLLVPILVAVALGCADLTLFGVRQRRLERPQPSL